MVRDQIAIPRYGAWKGPGSVLEPFGYWCVFISGKHYFLVLASGIRRLGDQAKAPCLKPSGIHFPLGIVSRG